MNYLTNCLNEVCYPLLSLKEFDDVWSTLQGTYKEENFPKFAVKQEENELMYQFALAGYPKDALKIEVQGDLLTVVGEKITNNENLFANRAFRWQRRDVYGMWDLENAVIEYRDGILTIKVNKKEEKKAKLLNIV